MLVITPNISIPLRDIEFRAIRAQGPGGQNVNKVASAVHLRFDVRASSLSEAQKLQILAYKDRRISPSGIVIIKAQNYRSQERNREEALERLQQILASALYKKPVRKPTRPSRGVIKRRLETKSRRGQTKALRGRVRDMD